MTTYLPQNQEEQVAEIIKTETILVGEQKIEASFKMQKAKEVFDEVNALREQKGLKKLIWNEKLAPFAKIRAVEASFSWSHKRPNGQPWNTVEPETNPDKKILHGENLGKGFKKTISLIKAWEKSKSHYENLVRSSFQSSYVAVYQEGDEIYYCILFSYK